MPRLSGPAQLRRSCRASRMRPSIASPDGTTATVCQVLDDATRYDVGSWAHSRHENSIDAKRVLEDAIERHGAPQELLSDNSSAFNQLRGGRIGNVEVFL